LGIDVKSLNKAGYNIPVFELLLAAPNPGNEMDGVQFPCYAQEKLNGVRCVYFPQLNQFLGRNGKIIPNVNLLKHIKINSDRVCDGELYWPGHDFNEIIGITSSDDKPIPEGFGFFMFNSLTQDEWTNQRCDLGYDLQWNQMSKVMDDSENVFIVNTKLVHSKEEAMKFFEEVVSQPNGEGIMLRGINSKYQWKRVKVSEDTLIKIKQEDEVDGEIIDTFEGENRHQGALGGVIVRLDDGVITRVGGGFKDDERKELWKIREKLIGKWILIKYTQRSPDNNLLFSIFKGFRDEK
jgi:DNA ligase-1